jgi:hypothetical protein
MSRATLFLLGLQFTSATSQLKTVVRAPGLLWETPSRQGYKDVFICIALPIRVNQQGQVDHMSKDLAGFVKGLGYKTIESHMVYIHNSLTREIMINEKT